MRKVYNKLVRDKIPELIKEPHSVEPLLPGEFLFYLDKKLEEEFNEYKASGDPKELVDMVEVIEAICDCNGWSKEVFRDVKKKKLKTRGGFQDRIKLNWVEINDNPPLYDVYINSKFVDSAENEDKTWELIRKYPIGSCYEVYHHGTKKYAEDFIPF